MVEEETEVAGAIIPTKTPKPKQIDCDRCGEKLILTDEQKYYCKCCKILFDK